LIRTNRPFLTLAALVSLGALGACSHDEPAAPAANETSATENTVVPAPQPSPTAVEMTNAAAAETVAPPAAPPPPPDQQVQEDADATGMTARVSRDAAANESVADTAHQDH
jgi:hypothetical protein